MKDVKTVLYYASIAYIAALSVWFLTRRGGICVRGAGKRGRRRGMAGRIMLLALWVGAVAYVTLLSRLGPGDPGTFIFSSGETMRSYADKRINLDPFRTVRDMVRGMRAGTFSPVSCALNLVGNLILFFPVAGFIRAFTKRRRLLLTFLWALAGSLAVEGTQMLMTIGSFDVDDLILNVGGAVLFAVLLVAFHRDGRRRKKSK